MGRTLHQQGIKMATKKTAAKKTARKTVAKKATTKRAYNRKAEAPVRQKRKYTRRAVQPSAEAQMALPLEQAQMAETAGETPDAGNGIAEETTPSNMAVLSEIDAIDLRALENGPRVLVLMALSNEGYISRELTDLVNNTSTLGRGLSAVGLELNHTNRLVRFIENGERIEPGTAISKPVVIQQSGKIAFEWPQAHSDVIEQNGALYARIG